MIKGKGVSGNTHSRSQLNNYANQNNPNNSANRANNNNRSNQMNPNNSAYQQSRGGNSKKGNQAPDPEPSSAELDGDEMLPAAVDVILETGQASVSMLQRRLKLGYARAARIVDEMEEKGIVGPFQGSKPRSILITKEQWEARKNGQSQQMGFDDMEDFGGVPEELD